MRQFNSMFSQLLSLFPRSEFEKAVRAHRADRAATSAALPRVTSA